MGGYYRLTQDTLGVISQNGKDVAANIPAGAEVRVSGPVEGVPGDPPNKQVLVHWNGSAVSIFAIDLQQRSERIPSGKQSRNGSEIIESMRDVI